MPIRSPRANAVADAMCQAGRSDQDCQQAMVRDESTEITSVACRSDFLHRIPACDAHRWAHSAFNTPAQGKEREAEE
jgi:hypothetical protein